MSPMPSLEELEQEFGSVIDDPGVIAVSEWTLGNSADPVDDEAVLARAESNLDAFVSLTPELLG